MSAFVDVLGLNPVNPSIPESLHQACPYASSLASSASSSASSVFSLDVSSQTSAASSSCASSDAIWENKVPVDIQEKRAAVANDAASAKARFSKVGETDVSTNLRQHPRRTVATRPPPTLVRQCERKTNFVDSLVDSASQIVEIIWPLSAAASQRGVESALGCKGVLPLRTFIQETLRRSRTSYSTLQVALYYLILIKPHVPSIDFTLEQPKLQQSHSRAMQCGRRMFLSALILASKYLQDRNYSARAWSKISGLNTAEINQNELMFLQAVDWRLHISDAIFQRWNDIVLKYTPNASGIPSASGMCWRTVIPILTPQLDTLDCQIEGPWTVSNVGSPADTATTPSSPSSCDSPSSSLSFSEIPRRPSAVDLASVTLPPLPRLGLLPTPQLTPQVSVTARTPAVSINACRPSICSALSQAQTAFVQRTTLDQRPTQPLYISKQQPSFDYPSGSFQGRRSSLARSSSFTSSPESLASDAPSLSFSSRSSRSSRSSSISSVTSMNCAIRTSRRSTPTSQPNNCLKENRKPLAIATPIDEHEPSYNTYPSPPLRSSSAASAVPDLSNFSIDTPSDPDTAAIQGLYELATGFPLSLDCTTPSPTKGGRRCRKRTRAPSTSEGTSLQQKVRHLMALDARDLEDDSTPLAVLSDSQVADSFLVNKVTGVSANGVSSKRACCGKENVRTLWGI
ncbi:cyclin Pas1 [Microsporum canis CBS 113480]|uniref:Cyclin Pas1 n=1 Tax=Arthroderma otae (strain ATCC MYA-4605 / CBS 113480) TaxID=554155 RepID=C5FWI4_ARTOC|nr:cyclin Pas1 [Microsporum canis CBS 113480]EEQ34268.1 cyclin Pas1 [Microsporum canis CBS 113480]